MNKYILPLIFVLSSLLSQAQTFNECVTDFRTKHKKIQLDATTQKTDKKKSDSLYFALESAFDACILGNKLPGFSLRSVSGKSYSNENLSGKVVYINLWRLNCAACWSEIPVLNKVDTLYRDNKDFVFISLLLDSEEDLENFFRKHGMRWRIDFDIVANAIPFDNKDLRNALAFPTHLFVDKYGKISKKLTGAFPDSQMQEAYLRAAIDETLAR